MYWCPFLLEALPILEGTLAMVSDLHILRVQGTLGFQSTIPASMLLGVGWLELHSRFLLAVLFEHWKHYYIIGGVMGAF